jgi:putative membrane protein
MSDFILEHYTWVKALHLIAVMSWMAGMLYLPRLYVYHIEQGQTSRMADVFKVMERRLLRFIMNPAMVATWVFGGLMIYANPDLMAQGWFHAKLTLVIALSAVHGMLAKYRRQLSTGSCAKTARYFRVLNELPTAIMVAVVILVIVKPF